MTTMTMEERQTIAPAAAAPAPKIHVKDFDFHYGAAKVLLHKSIDQLRAEATSKDGIRRIGTPADIAALTLFLSSEKARHIQGTAIAVHLPADALRVLSDPSAPEGAPTPEGVGEG